MTATLFDSTMTHAVARPTHGEDREYEIIA